MNTLIRILAIVLFFVLLNTKMYAQFPALSDTAISFTTALDNDYLCPEKNELFYYADISGCSLGKRVPLNITVVFDRSGSMEGERMYYGRLALDYLIDHLTPDDNLAIIIYDHEVEILHSATPVFNKEELKKKLHHIKPMGYTNIGAGLEEGFREAGYSYDSTMINKVFLLSDGVPTAGILDHFMLQKIVSDYCHKNKLSLSTFGLGHEFHEALMHDLAEAGGGHYYYIEKPQDAAVDFGKEIFTLLSVVAQNTYLIVEFPSDMVTPGKVYGHHSTVYGNKIFIDLKEVHPNENNGILIKFTIKQKITTPLSFQSSLKYNNAFTNQRVSKQLSNTISPTTDNNSCVAHVNRNVLEKVAYFTSNDLMESAMADAERNNMESARAKIKKSKDIIATCPEKDTSSLLQNQYSVLNEYDTHLSQWHTKSEHDINHLHKKMRYKNYQLRKMKKVTSNSIHQRGFIPFQSEQYFASQLQEYINLNKHYLSMIFDPVLYY